MQVESKVQVSSADVRPIAEAAQRLFEANGGVSEVIFCDEFRTAIRNLYQQAFDMGREFERRNPSE